MNQQVETDEIKPLIINYIFHFILYILIFVMHLVVYYKVYWIYNSLNILFLLFTYCNLLYILFPIIPVIILLLRKYKKKIISFLKIISLIFLIISLIFGLTLSISLLINTINSKLFCRECPFNISINYLNSIFQSYYGKKASGENIKKLCNSRRCVLDQENLDEKYPYIYLCNYNPSDDFHDMDEFTKKLPDGTEIKTKYQIKCSPVISINSGYNFKHNELYSYINLCFLFTDFYKCERFNEPEKKYNLELDSTCPETNYLTILYIILVLVIIVDLIIPLIPWRIEYLSFKSILSILNLTHLEANSVNSTAKNSKISENEINFKKEKTPVLIFPSEFRINTENIITNENLITEANQNNENNMNNLTTSFKEDEKVEPKKKLINFKQIQNSERSKLYMRNLDVKDNNIIDNRLNTYKKINKNIHQESTTYISTYKLKKTENNENKIDEDEDEK